MALTDTLYNVNNKYLTPEFMQIINDHIFILRSKSQTKVVGGDIASKFKDDFHGLMRHLGVLPQYWYATMRVNGLRSPLESGTMYYVSIPDTQYIEDLLSVHKLSKRNLF